MRKYTATLLYSCPRFPRIIGKIHMDGHVHPFIWARDEDHALAQLDAYVVRYRSILLTDHDADPAGWVCADIEPVVKVTKRDCAQCGNPVERARVQAGSKVCAACGAVAPVRARETILACKVRPETVQVTAPPRVREHPEIETRPIMRPSVLPEDVPMRPERAEDPVVHYWCRPRSNEPLPPSEVDPITKKLRPRVKPSDASAMEQRPFDRPRRGKKGQNRTDVTGERIT